MAQLKQRTRADGRSAKPARPFRFIGRRPGEDTMLSAGDGKSAVPSLSASYRLAPKSAADAIGDVFAGLIVAVMNIALAMSFSALLFKGALQSGYSTGLWAILVTVTLVGLIVGWLTSLPPLTGNADTAVVAAMGFLVTAIARPLLDRGVASSVVMQNVMVGLTIVAVVTGLVFVMIGWFRVGKALRFIPFPLVSGFLVSTGILLMISAITIVVGGAVSISGSVPVGARVRLLMMITVAIALWGLPKLFKSALTGPLAFIGLVVALNSAIGRGLLADPRSWYLPGIGGLVPWSPLSSSTLSNVNWPVIGSATPDILTCVAVGLISIIVKVASMESRRGEIADLDHELRVNGIACLACGPAGGMAGMLGSGGSELLIDAGARTRLAALITTMAVGAVIILKIDLAAIVPTPLLGGLLFRSGFKIASDTILRVYGQRSAMETSLTVVITLISVKFGYDAGIVVGFVAACLMFALSYGRIGVIRRHVTRASMNGGVERSHESESLLRRHGDAIHLYTLSGYVFFGSAEALFEEIRSTVEAQVTPLVRFIILDFAAVTGLDGSTFGTLAKLDVLAGRRDISIAFTNIAAPLLRRLTGTRPAGRREAPRVFANNIEALSWCEPLLLAEVAPVIAAAAPVDFERWLSAELRCEWTHEAVATFFEKQTVAAGTTIYCQGEKSETIDFIDSGTLAVSVVDARGNVQALRLLTQRTVVGEMGFFRGGRRSASISAHTASVVYTLGVDTMDRLERDRPALYEAMLTFFIRTLADRVEQAQIEITALRA